MSKFASHENSPTEQRVIGRELEALLGAVEVTGLSAWERARKLHGGLAEGEVSEQPQKWGADGAAKRPSISPSASPAVQQHLFEGEAA